MQVFTPYKIGNVYFLVHTGSSFADTGQSKVPLTVSSSRQLGTGTVSACPSVSLPGRQSVHGAGRSRFSSSISWQSDRGNYFTCTIYFSYKNKLSPSDTVVMILAFVTQALPKNRSHIAPSCLTGLRNTPFPSLPRPIPFTMPHVRKVLEGF